MLGPSFFVWDLQGLVKLADFGVAAKLAEMEDGGAALRSSVVGTPYWMAPEVGLTCQRQNAAVSPHALILPSASHLRLMVSKHAVMLSSSMNLLKAAAAVQQSCQVQSKISGHCVSLQEMHTILLPGSVGSCCHVCLGSSLYQR